MWERSAPCIDISVGADVYETFMYVFTWPMVWPEILCHKARFVRFTRPTTSYGRGNISPSSHADFGCCRSVSSSLPQLSTLELSEIWFLSDKLKCGIVMDQNLRRGCFGKIDRNSSNLLLLLLMYTYIFLTQIHTRVLVILVIYYYNWLTNLQCGLIWKHLHSCFICCMHGFISYHMILYRVVRCVL